MNEITTARKITSKHLVLSLAQKENYQRDGFLIIENFLAADICNLLIERANTLINNFDPSNLKVIFSTKDSRHAKNLYFLDSGDKIRFFFEENSIDANGELVADKLFCINKIGHALHELDPIFNCVSRSHKIAALANDLNIADPLLIQSMYICKQPYIGAEVTCHQDSTYLFIKDQPVTGLWFALEDATLENACLWAIPGAHQLPLKSRLMRDHHNKITTQVYDDTPWQLDKMVPLEVSKGSLIVLHGLLPHMSKENSSPRSRNAYILHLSSGRHEYANENWLQRPNDMPFRGFL